MIGGVRENDIPEPHRKVCGTTFCKAGRTLPLHTDRMSGFSVPTPFVARISALISPTTTASAP